MSEGFAPKVYQQQVLDSTEAYFKACHELPTASLAFTSTTERLWGLGNVYHPLADLPPDTPYFCLRARDSDTHFAASQLVGGFVGVPVSRPD